MSEAKCGCRVTPQLMTVEDAPVQTYQVVVKIDRCHLHAAAEELQKAIGVYVSSIIRVFIDKAKRDGETIDVELGEKVLLRVEKAMVSAAKGRTP